jgi:hypothetical protein
MGVLALSSLVAACGGGGGGGTTPPPAAAGGTVSGTVFFGATGGATVAAFAVTDGTMGAQVGGATADAAGGFTVPIGDHAGPLMLEARGGTFVDPATGTTMTMQPGDVMAAAIPSVAAGAVTTGIQITPLTTMAHERAHHLPGGITEAGIAAANAATGAYFSVSDVLHVAPMDPAVAGSGTGASPDAVNYGMTIAAMSQYASGLGMPQPSGIVTAMAADASDGVMDGAMAGQPIPMGGGMGAGTMMQPAAGTAGLAGAMSAFAASPRNRSGVTAAQVQPLVTQLQGTGGQVPGGGGTATGMMGGTATMGRVAGGTVTAYAIANGRMGAQLGSAPTDASGNFQVAIGTYGGPVMLRMTGGTFADEATGTSMPMLPGDALVVCVPAVAPGTTTPGVQLTPLTSMAQARAQAMTGGMTDANVVAANSAVGAYFSVGDIVHGTPMDPTVAGSGSGASVDARNHGMAIAAMSRYAQGLGMTSSSSGIVTALMDDASDGVMDGRMGSVAISMGGMGGMMGGTMSPTAGTTGLASALGAFVASPMNRSGVTPADMQPLAAQLAGATGQLPGAGGTATPQGSVSGTAFMGNMSSGTVTAYAVTNGAMGAPIASTSVDASGSFTLPLGAYAGTLMLQVAGGSFADEATGTTMTMQPGDVLTACVPSLAAGATTTGVQVTPLTAMAQARAQYMAGGMTPANVTAANGSVGSYFMVGDILGTHPMDPAVAGSGAGASPDARYHGMAIAAMSRYAEAMGMTASSSGMVTAMMQDASDGIMNGMMGSTSVAMTGMGGMGGGMMGGTMMQPGAGTTGLASAMTAFVGSTENRSGLGATEVQPLVTRLSTSSGALP